MVMRLDGQQVYVTPFVERHLVDAEYRGWLSDPEVVRYLGRPEYLAPVPFEEIRGYVERLWADDRCSFFAVHSLADGRFIGTTKVAFKDRSGPAHDVADVGVMIGNRASWGKGMATDALRVTCGHAFDGLGARKLTAGAMSPNVAVIKAFLRIGFIEEGRLRAQFVVADRLADHVLLGCLSPELKRT
jgi:[ribosomal protein S5]-alanine N-acetyltransferase